MLSTKLPLSPSSTPSPAIPTIPAITRPKMNSKLNSRQSIPSLSITPHTPSHLSIHSTLNHHPSSAPLPCPDLLASSLRPFKFHGRHQVLDLFRSEMESSMFKQVSMVHNTYFLDPDAYEGFISVPHLGNFGCPDANIIARLTEQAIVENINSTILVEDSTNSGNASMNFKKTLETVVDNVVDMVKNGLQQNHHLSKILIEIKAGQKSCHCVQDFLIPEAQIYLEQYPIFIDVVIKVSRHPSLPPTPSTPPPPKAFSTEPMNVTHQIAQPQTEAESTTEILVFVEHDYMYATSTTDFEHSNDTSKKGNAKEMIKQQKLKRVNSFGVVDCAEFALSA